MSTGTCGLKLYTQNNIFENYKYENLDQLYFYPGFVFWGTALGRFSQCFFIYHRQSTMVANIFSQPCHHKTASYDLAEYHQMVDTYFFYTLYEEAIVY